MKVSEFMDTPVRHKGGRIRQRGSYRAARREAAKATYREMKRIPGYNNMVQGKTNG